MNQPVLMPVHLLASAVLGLLVPLAPAALVAYKTNQWVHLLRHNLISDLRAQARVVAPGLFAGDCGCLGDSTVREAYKICLRLAALRRMIADVVLN